MLCYIRKEGYEEGVNLSHFVGGCLGCGGLVIGLTIAGNSRYDFSPRFKRKGV